MKPILLLALLATGCGQSSLAPSPVATPVSGSSILVDSVSDNACIVSLRDQARRDPNYLTGILTDTTLTLRDQFGTTTTWARAGSQYVAHPADSISGPCQVREHVVSATMTLTQSGDTLFGFRVNHYDLYSLDGIPTSQTVTDTETVSLTIR